MRVLIAGAGPTGLTAAVELARHGIVADVIDRKMSPSTLSRAVGILPSSLKTLTPSGVTARLLDEGIKIKEIQVFRKTQRVLRLPLTKGHPEMDFALALGQDRTEQILQDELVGLGGTVQYNRELVDFRQDADHVVTETHDGQKSKYDYLLGADGVQSMTRRCLDLEFVGIDLPETWSIADVDAKGWQNPVGFTLCWAGPGCVAVVVPLESNRYRVVSNTLDALDTLPLPMNVERIRRKSPFRISVRQVPTYQIGRVFLAGDAAHCHSPVGGRGMNLGIADAAEFAQRLVDDQLDGYSCSRHVAGQRTIAVSERARRLLTSSSTLGIMIVLAACPLIQFVPAIRRSVARMFLDA